MKLQHPFPMTVFGMLRALFAKSLTSQFPHCHQTTKTPLGTIVKVSLICSLSIAVLLHSGCSTAKEAKIDPDRMVGPIVVKNPDGRYTTVQALQRSANTPDLASSVRNSLLP
jgi:hypothetical protein